MGCRIRRARRSCCAHRRLAKALGEMTAADAIDYLAGPEPRKAGISDEVIEALRSEIVNAVAAAKRAAAKEAAAASEAEREMSSSPDASIAGPADDSEEAMRRWREYCAQALAAAENAEQAREQGAPGESEPSSVPGAAVAATEGPPLFKPRASDDPPLFKPRAAAPSAPSVGSGDVPGSGAKDADTRGDGAKSDATPPSGFEWGPSF